RAGHESRHNRLYWAQADYRGFGCAAHSHQAGRRWWNVRTPDRYIDLVERDESIIAADEELDDATRSVEGRQLALRTRDGVDTTAFDRSELDELVGDGLVERVTPTRVALTRRGRLLANEVALRVIE
ncbi:MAG: coproporphyrinogen III oxidase, partial [Actinomycetota bacterium]